MSAPNRVRVKPGVQFTVIAPGGFRLLGAIERAARVVGCDLTITSACDGVHSGPDDPHHRGEAYDIRTHDLDEGQKGAVLAVMLAYCRLDDEPPAEKVAGVPFSLATQKFFGFLEAPGTDAEHLHVQCRKGEAY